MNRFDLHAKAVALLSVGILALASCNCEKKPETAAPATKAETATPAPSATAQPAPAQPAPATRSASASTDSGTSTVKVQEGVAGGVVEETFTTSVTITAIDPATRNITLTSADGDKATFKAGPEIRNFDQIHVGDKLSATIAQRIVIFVRSGDADPSVTHAAALARAPKGAKPGALIAESYEITASVTAIDSAKRTATLKFANGQTKTVPVRSDVDMSRYKVGDTVVIRVTEALALLVDKP